MSNVENEIAQLTLDDIQVDETQNVRKTYGDAAHKGLTAAIKREGLTQTLVVRPAIEGETHGKPWFLVAGYRRMRSLRELKFDKAGCTIVRGVDKKGSAIINITENINRQSLTSYEMALGFKDLRVSYGMTGEEISKTMKGENLEKGKSKQNVNNLIRLLDDLHPEIIKAWSDEHEKATTYNLLSIVAKGDHEAQWTLWEAYCGIGEDSEDEDTGTEETGGTDEPEAAKPKCRPALEVIAAMALVRKSTKDGEISDSDGKLMIDVLKWCVKKRQTLPGVKIKESEAA